MTFTEYAKAQGCVLLNDDIKYLKRLLRYTPKTDKKALLRRYVSVWVDRMEKEKNALQRQNLGRREANTWIRETINAEKEKIVRK